MSHDPILMSTGRLSTLRLLSVAVLTVISVLIAGCSIPGNQVVDDEGIVGTYTLNGIDANDLEYSGTVVITPEGGSGRYGIQWLVTGAIHGGTAELNGDRLTATWKSITTPRGESTGTASYVLDDDGNFEGTKTIDGVDGLATETIFQAA